ncbi:LOW QUALITY PROTEIN: protein mono-ADP-ribosyltransferase PARP10 [Heliangelus exortis]|uniref:LOW QUALITY PROTEIN: protein mono-ADP-ribosyltransferase PARP10 n=1 Tax=Heliangelus exortis TaxID=472823 RepID=UPI003A94CBCF
MAEGGPGAVLEVGAPPQLEEELLVLYFESRRRSGGGPVRSCQRLGPLLFLTFESPQDAQNVLARGNHRLGGVELEVRPAAPWDPSHLLLGGLNPQIPSELLEQHLETLLGRSPSAITLCQGPAPGWGLLHLQDPLTPQELWLAEGRARGSSLWLLRVPQTPSLLVGGGGAPLSPDLLELYFENRRSGGGPIQQLQLLPGGQAAIVTFQELAVAQRVLQRRNHRLQDLVLTLAPHYPFLGAIGRDQDPLTLGRDPPINTEPMAPDSNPPSDRDLQRDKDPPRDRDPLRVMDPPRDMAPLVKTAPPGVTDPSWDMDPPRDRDPPRVMDPPRDTAPLVKTAPPGVMDPPRDMAPLVKTAPPAVTDPPRDTDPPGDRDPPRDMAPLVKTAPPGVTDPLRDTDSQRVMDPPRDMDPIPDPAPGPPPAPGPSSAPPSVIALGAPLVSGEEEEVVVPGERGSVRYLQQHSQDLLGSISHVLVLPLEGGDVAGFRVSGERQQCRAVGEFLQSLLGTVGTWPLTLHFPGVARFLRDQGGQSLLQQVEEQFQCVIELEGVCWSPPEQQLDLVELLPQCCHQDPPAVAPPPQHCNLLRDADGDSGPSSVEEITELLATLHPGDNAGESGDTLGWQQDPRDDFPPASNPHWGSRVGEEEEVQMALATQCSMEMEQHQEEEALAQATALSLHSYREEEEEALAHATALSLSSYHQEEEEAEAAVLQVALEASLEEALLAADSVRVTVFTAQEAPEVLAGLERALAGQLQTQEVTHERLRALPPSCQHPLALLQHRHAVRLTLRPGTATFCGFPPYTSQAAQDLQSFLQNLPEPQPGFGAGGGGTPSGTAVHSASGIRAEGCLGEEGVQLLALSPRSPEFQDVVRNFYSSLGDLQSQVTILQVQKLEHPLLARQYQLKKVSMERACGGACVERVLFHGTTQSSSREICLHGFNRSFCGKNAALYGRGVYFAVRSVLSARDLYSPRSPDGTKFIFVAKVLTGLFTKGGPGLRAPPLREGMGVPLRYHSVVDDPRHPNVFVIFNDTQAYPQYLLICQGPPP